MWTELGWRDWGIHFSLHRAPRGTGWSLGWEEKQDSCQLGAVGDSGWALPACLVLGLLDPNSKRNNTLIHGLTTTTAATTIIIYKS